jgi:GH18 family chitinase
MSADPEKMKFSNIAGLKNAGGWAPSLAHHSNLQESLLSNFAGVKALAYLGSVGIPANMIHLGVANYARAAAEAEFELIKI